MKIVMFIACKAIPMIAFYSGNVIIIIHITYIVNQAWGSQLIA